MNCCSCFLRWYSKESTIPVSFEAGLGNATSWTNGYMSTNNWPIISGFFCSTCRGHLICASAVLFPRIPPLIVKDNMWRWTYKYNIRVCVNCVSITVLAESLASLGDIGMQGDETMRLYSLNERSSYRKIVRQSRSRGIQVKTFQVAVTFDRHLGSNAVDFSNFSKLIRTDWWNKHVILNRMPNGHLYIWHIWLLYPISIMNFRLNK